MESSSKQSDDGMEEQNQKSDDRMGDTDQKSDEGNVCMGDTRANCQNQLSSDMAVSNDPEMLPSTSSREISSIQSISVDILQEDDPQEVTSSFGDPIHQTSNTATVGSTSSCKTMASNASFSELWPIVWLAMCIVVLVIKILQNNFHPAPYDHDLQDPWRRCATMADSTTNHQNLSPVDSPLLELPRTDFTIQEEGIRRGADVQFTNNTMRPEARQGSDEEDQSLLEISQQTSVNGTNNEESYMDSMFRQERSHSQINHQDVIRISSNNWMTRSTDMCPDINETTSSEGEEVQSNITTRPPENRPQGVPHGGRVYLRNTCSLDQFLNGLYQVCRFTPIRNQLEKLVRRFPDAYELLWRALLLCEEERFPEAKHVLVPRLNMYSNEYLQIRTLLEGQLHHWFTSLCCECEDWISISQNLTEILLNEFNPEGGLQEALRSICSLPNGTCNQPGCGSRTNIRVEFELGNPPMFLAIHLRHLISNSGSINFTEVVELFGERYFLFLFTMIRPPSSEGELGHFMSYVFRPDGGTEMGTDGRPVGAWYWFPNDFDGTLERRTPGQEDPEGTFPVTAYLVQIPPSSSGEATSDQEEEGPIQKGDDNKE
ncbi:uncharacterized protein LOC117326313 isoform X4 [Pecten maximus]|nr:uncharacterized protein LOC117326313 isoform X4 [Pecten maximus]XP_033738899.1 uncharacterized protein LOC117326313 isoform X4 [Pecten maximus]